MKKIVSVVAVLALMLSLGAGLSLTTFAATVSEGDGNISIPHCYSRNEYVYTEDGKIQNMTCVIPEFVISSLGSTAPASGTITYGSIAVKFGGISFPASYKAESFYYTESTSTSVNGSVVIPGIGGGVVSESRSGYGWEIEITINSNQTPMALPTPYNCKNVHLEIKGEIKDANVFPQTTMSMSDASFELETDPFVRKDSSITVALARLDMGFYGSYSNESKRVELELIGDAYTHCEGLTITLSPSQQTARESVGESQVKYYGSTGLRMDVRRYVIDCGEQSGICYNDIAETIESVKPTCTQRGYTVKQCNECGYEETFMFEALGHNYIDGECTRCGNHTYNNGSLTTAQVKELQEILGVEVDGKYGPGTKAAAGGLTADEAYNKFVTGGSNQDQEQESYLPGDVNGDGRINFSDYSKTLYCAKNPGTLDENSDEFKRMDINGDGRINFSDYAQILALAKGN